MVHGWPCVSRDPEFNALPERNLLLRDLANNVEQAVEVIRNHRSGSPRVGIILGTGLGSVASKIDTEAAIDYAAIPHFPRSTAVSHAGQLVCGSLCGVPLAILLINNNYPNVGYSGIDFVHDTRNIRK